MSKPSSSKSDRKRRSAKPTPSRKSANHRTGPSPADDGYIVNEQIGYVLRVTMQRHTAIFTSMMVEGITQTQFATLAKLLEVGPCSHNRLGRLIALDAPTIKGVLDRLKLRGLVVSLADDTHRSRRMVQLTERGAAITKRAVQIGRTITEATLDPLSADERHCLMRLLDRIMRDKSPSPPEVPALARPKLRNVPK